MTFDPDFYWTAQGSALARESVSPEHKETELILRSLLRQRIALQSVIDVGCGMGRLAKVLAEELPDVKYTGLDLGQEQLDGTREVRPDGEFFLARLQDFIPDKRWDLAICSEVLLHIPPLDIKYAVLNLERLAPWLIVVDWTESVSGPIAEWNWLYDYDKLFRRSEIVERYRVGLQTVFLILTGNA